MTPDDYCRGRAAPPGSSLHYALAFLPDAARRGITALAALAGELAGTARDTSDAGVAATQLAWWRSELETLGGGTPQHPVTRALASHAGVIGRADLLTLVEAAEADLARPRHAAFASLATHCDAWGGHLAALSARLAHPEAGAVAERARPLGAALRLGEILQQVGEDARRNRIYLPQEDLARYAVTAAEILQHRPGSGFVSLMQFETARHAQRLREAAESLTPEERRRLRPALILSRLQSTLLDEIARDGFRVLDERASLTPIRKLWIAMRTK
jgi:phytoene synthase